MLKQFLANLMNNNESSISNRYIADMKIIHKDLYDIRKSLSEMTDIDYAGDIADNISAYEIASHIDVDASDIEVDTRDLAERIARELGGNIDIDYSDLGITISDNIDLNEVNARINNVHTNLQTVERKMDLILKHLGITPENA